MSVRHTLLQVHEVDGRKAWILRTVAIVLTQAGAATTGVGLEDREVRLWLGGIFAFLVGVVLVAVAAREAGWRIGLLRGFYLFSDFGVNVAGVMLAVGLGIFLKEHAGHHQSWPLLKTGLIGLLVTGAVRAASEGSLENQESGHRSTE